MIYLIQNISTKKFLNWTGWTEDTDHARFFHNEKDAQRLINLITQSLYKEDFAKHPLYEINEDDLTVKPFIIKEVILQNV